MEETFNDNDNDNERNEENFFDGDYFDYLNKNNNNSASVKKDEKKNIKRINSFDNLDEEFHSKTELNNKNNKNINRKYPKQKEKQKEKINEDVKEIQLTKKKTTRKFDDNKKKKKNHECKTKTEINDYQNIKEKNQDYFEKFAGYQEMNDEDLYSNIMYDNQEKTDGFIKTLEDFDAQVNVNQNKHAYECKTNVDESEGLNMFISSEINKQNLIRVF